MPQNQLDNKKIKNGTVRKKAWRIKDKNSHDWLEFFPIFEVSEETNEIECRFVEMKFSKGGKEHTFTFDWLNIYMFMYHTCNEELRLGLAQRYERKVNYIPYDIQTRISDEEKAAGILKRRVELPVDELTMAIARDEAWRILLKNKAKINDPKSFQYMKPKPRSVGL